MLSETSPAVILGPEPLHTGRNSMICCATPDTLSERRKRDGKEEGEAACKLNCCNPALQWYAGGYAGRHEVKFRLGFTAIATAGECCGSQWLPSSRPSTNSGAHTGTDQPSNLSPFALSSTGGTGRLIWPCYGQVQITGYDLPH